MFAGLKERLVGTPSRLEVPRSPSFYTKNLWGSYPDTRYLKDVRRAIESGPDTPGGREHLDWLKSNPGSKPASLFFSDKKLRYVFFGAADDATVPYLKPHFQEGTLEEKILTLDFLLHPVGRIVFVRPEKPSVSGS